MRPCATAVLNGKTHVTCTCVAKSDIFFKSRLSISVLEKWEGGFELTRK